MSKNEEFCIKYDEFAGALGVLATCADSPATLDSPRRARTAVILTEPSLAAPVLALTAERRSKTWTLRPPQPALASLLLAATIVSHLATRASGAPHKPALSPAARMASGLAPWFAPPSPALLGSQLPTLTARATAPLERFAITRAPLASPGALIMSADQMPVFREDPAEESRAIQMQVQMRISPTQIATLPIHAPELSVSLATTTAVMVSYRQESMCAALIIHSLVAAVFSLTAEPSSRFRPSYRIALVTSTWEKSASLRAPPGTSLLPAMVSSLATSLGHGAAPIRSPAQISMNAWSTTVDVARAHASTLTVRLAVTAAQPVPRSTVPVASPIHVPRP